MTCMPSRFAPLACILMPMLIAASGCNDVKASLLKIFASQYEAAGDPSHLTPLFIQKDLERPRIQVRLTTITTVNQPTDIQFPPGRETTLFALEKTGRIKWYNWQTRTGGTLLQVPQVITASEQGLLGLAFHPDFDTNGLFYLNYSTTRGAQDISRSEEWQLIGGHDLTRARDSRQRTILEVDRP